MKGILLLEDGTCFKGSGFGAEGKKCGEVVFNTAMTGYQEILTDPSYHEQIITMTYPLIGNYGTNMLDVESGKPYLSGFVVKENCNFPSNWRNGLSLDEYLKKYNIPAIEDIDTRKLVMLLRRTGSMKGIICTDGTSVKELKDELDKYPGLVNLERGSAGLSLSHLARSGPNALEFVAWNQSKRHGRDYKSRPLCWLVYRTKS